MRYRIDYANVDIHVDSYTEGELEYIQTFDLPITGTYDTMDDVLKAIENTYMGFTSDPKNYCYIDGRIDTDSLVDVNNYEADEDDIELWKKGELTLYNAHLMCGMSVISDEHELSENEAEELGFEIC